MAKNTPARKPTGKRGGRRPGAGRKPKDVNQSIRDLEEQVNNEIGIHAMKLLGNLLFLANGGFERVTLTEERAADGTLLESKRVVEVAAPDRAANEYLLNRRLGKPKQAVELSGKEGEPIPVSIEMAIGQIYGKEETDDE